MKQNRAGKEVAKTGIQAGAKTGYRAGRGNVTGYFAPSVKTSLRLIQAKHPERTVQDLLEEALNGLFEKYGVPQSASIAPKGHR